MEPVDIHYDRIGVPHIQARTLPDLFYAQGRCHARDRLWQMELSRRVASGRLAEAFGARALPVDRWMRRLGLSRAVQDEVVRLDPEELRVLRAYAAGVNAAARRPLEMLLLGLKWQPWQPADSLLWVRMMALDLSGNWQAELARAELLQKVGPELGAVLGMVHPAGQPQTLGGLTPDALAELTREMKQVMPLLGGGGSNCWAVAGHRSATGFPLLANDPHLNLSWPCVWFENHLTAPGLDVSGVSLPGVPGVVLGRNRDLAWGVTNSCVDVVDLYTERLQGDRCQVDGIWQPCQVVEERIPVRGRKQPEVERVLITRHGPILTEWQGWGLAVRWAGAEPAHLVRGVLALNRAASVEEGREALRHWAYPSLNVLLADRQHIAYQLCGRVPVRARGTGLVPVPGWTSEHEWTGFIPFEELPHLQDPPEGVLVSANAQIAGPDYPYHLSWDFTSGTRVARIQQVLDSRARHDLEDFRLLQLDVRTPLGPRFVACVAGVHPRSAGERRALETLRAWDGEVRADSAGAAVYEVWLAALVEQALEPLLGRDPLETMLGRSRSPVGLLSEHAGRIQVSVLEALERREPALGDWDALLAGSLSEACRRLGPGPWRWGKLHWLRPRHAFSEVPVLGWIFGAPRLEMPGDADTPFQTHPIPGGGISWAPSWRHVVDMGQPHRAWTSKAGGQSGRLLSRHRLDGLRGWAAGRMETSWMDPDDIQAHLESSLRIEPQID